MKILIDGYNLIFECGLHGRQINPQSLARARQLLLAQIQAAFTKSEQRQIAVVFDAEKVPLLDKRLPELSGEVQVMYSLEFEDADAMIEDLIARHSVPKQLLVVSSDHRLHKAARARKATAVDSGDWYDEITGAAAAVKPDRSTGLADDMPTQKKQRGAALLSEQDLELFKQDVDDQIERHQRDRRK